MDQMEMLRWALEPYKYRTRVKAFIESPGNRKPKQNNKMSRWKRKQEVIRNRLRKEK